MVDAIVKDLEQIGPQGDEGARGLQHAHVRGGGRGGDRPSDGVRGVLGTMQWRENTRSWLQEVHGALQRLLYREQLLPIGVRPGPAWAPPAASETGATLHTTPHDGISHVWGIERGGAIVRALIRQFLERVSPMLPRDATCLEWGRYYSQTVLADECHCGNGRGFCPFSWSLEYGGCTEGVDAARREVCVDVAQLSRLVPAELRFDVIVCTQVFEHLPDPWAAARELYQVMAPGAKMVFTVPFMEPHHEAPAQFKDYWRFSLEGVRLLLEGAGFHIDVLETAGMRGVVRKDPPSLTVSELIWSVVGLQATACSLTRL